MRIPVQLLVLVMLSPTWAHADASLMSVYMACARAIGVAINEKFAVVPGERAGLKGLFVYTDRSASFLPLGAPRSEDNDAHDFFLRTNIPGVGDVFLVYRERKPGSASNVQSAIGYQTTPPPKDDLANYRVTAAGDLPGDQGRAVLSRRLKEKIATVKEFIDDKNSLSTPEQAKVAFAKDRVVYRAKLETCRLEEDRDLKLAVSEEVQKLDLGFPSITVWEKLVGGRPPPSHASKRTSAVY